MKLLNIGAGNLSLSGRLGFDEEIKVDWSAEVGADVVHDVAVFPWPFEDEAFDGVAAFDIVEHMLEVIPFINECWRVLKPGGNLYVHTTHWKTHNSFTDPTHFHFFTENSFDYWDPSTLYGQKYGFYRGNSRHHRRGSGCYHFKIAECNMDGQELFFRLTKRPCADAPRE